MAEQSKITKSDKRRAMVACYAARRAVLKAVMGTGHLPGVRKSG